MSIPISQFIPLCQELGTKTRYIFYYIRHIYTHESQIRYLSSYLSSEIETLRSSCYLSVFFKDTTVPLIYQCLKIEPSPHPTTLSNRYTLPPVFPLSKYHIAIHPAAQIWNLGFTLNSSSSHSILFPHLWMLILCLPFLPYLSRFQLKSHGAQETFAGLPRLVRCSHTSTTMPLITQCNNFLFVFLAH